MTKLYAGSFLREDGSAYGCVFVSERERENWVQMCVNDVDLTYDNDNPIIPETVERFES